MSTLDLSELNNRLQLLRKLEKLGTDEAVQLTIKRFNDLSNFLQKALHDVMQIEEVDLMDARDMTLDRMSEVRKKVTRLRGLIGTQLNPLFELLHAFMTDSSDKKG
ncbi:unnamed protein product [Sphagnum jensenii]|uniref:Uncharacterized protein n=1 Tax=Sphagnum jensenii TaxID=128206 RepID=A0ABP0V960_9BRYO